MPSNTLFYYLQRVEREAGLLVSASFPTSPTDYEQRCLDAINESLRKINNKYRLLFKLTQYTLTTTAGTEGYNLALAPYNQTFWRANRMARNGVIRVSDDYPLDYMDYAERDSFRPDYTGKARALAYSVKGENLVFWPNPNGEQYYIRYYGAHIGLDADGTTQKLRLTDSDDVTLLGDEWEDYLVADAVAHVRLKDGVDAKYNEWKQKAEVWEKTVVDMTQAGEDAPPQMVVKPFTFDNRQQRYFPFFTPFEK